MSPLFQLRNWYLKPAMGKQYIFKRYGNISYQRYFHLLQVPILLENYQLI